MGFLFYLAPLAMLVSPLQWRGVGGEVALTSTSLSLLLRLTSRSSLGAIVSVDRNVIMAQVARPYADSFIRGQAALYAAVQFNEDVSLPHDCRRRRLAVACRFAIGD